jgi:ZIP family zinc transporter
MLNGILWAAGGTGFTFLLTSLGAAAVFFFRRAVADRLQKVFFGFAAGVMIAASVWSMLIPAIEDAEALGMAGWIPAVIGFLMGGGMMMFLDLLVSRLRGGERDRSAILFLAVTLHNIPEGMAVGLAWPLALGIGIQNFPEGAAVSLPLRKKGLSKTKAFLLGSATGIVEPIFGCLAILLAQHATILMPWLLAFAAGAMIYVVVEELIPEAHFGESSSIGTISTIFGFLLMMILDVSFS